jgi:hypothetical protein
MMAGILPVAGLARWPRGHPDHSGIRRWWFMTGEAIRDLLVPLIGKSGSLSMVVSRVGQIAFATSENKRLTGVEIRPDGLVRLDRETGWAVVDPREIVSVVWHGETESVPGQFL